METTHPHGKHWHLLLLLAVTLLASLHISPVTSLSNVAFNSNVRARVASSVAKEERRKKERQSKSRQVCPNCNRPPVTCVCEALPEDKIQTGTTVLILQHPNEFKRKSLSTVPLIPLVLNDCTIKVGYEFELEQLDLVQDFLARGKAPLLLYPGPNATSLDEPNDIVHEHNVESSTQDSAKEEHLLILIDGTWSEARRMVLSSAAFVQQCRQVQFTSNATSIYSGLRKEPDAHCLSTLEACSQTLALLEPKNGEAKKAKGALEHAMRYMVEIKQSIYAERNPEPRFLRPGVKEMERVKKLKEIEESMFQSGGQ